jgi:membrane-associated phospholipid phosphatase
VCLGLAVLLLPYRRAGAGRAAVAAVAVACLLVGVALVWCDYHWFTDVVAGWALAVLIIQAALLLNRQGSRPWSMTPRGRGRG